MAYPLPVYLQERVKKTLSQMRKKDRHSGDGARAARLSHKQSNGGFDSHPRNRLKPYPVWVCQSCGSAASCGLQASMSTWHMGMCQVCCHRAPVTEPRDFGYPGFHGHAIS